MTLNELIGNVNTVYPDGLIEQNFDRRRQCQTKKAHGDTLAYFIVTELCETFEPDAPTLEQVEEAIRVMQIARDELATVVATLENLAFVNGKGR